MLELDSASLPHFRTERLVVRLGDSADVGAIVSYFVDNREHLRPFDPERPAAFFSEEFWHAQVRQSVIDFYSDRALRLFLFDRHDPGRVLGLANFTQIVRGVAQFCNLGYSLAADAQGRGLMYEALQPALSYAFGAMGLHRVQANYMPHNLRSGALLRRLGFVVEGFARDYLRINGRWEDHLLTSLTNHHWAGDRDP